MKLYKIFFWSVVITVFLSSCSNTNVLPHSDSTTYNTVPSATDKAYEETEVELHMPNVIVISGCYDGESTIIKPKGTDSILFQTGESDASIIELSESQIQHLNETYDSITDFSESSDKMSSSTVTIKTDHQTYAFGLGCASQQLLNEYIDYLLSLEA